MYDVRPLEEDWEKYQFKRRKPWYLLIVSLIFIFLILFFLVSDKNGISFFNKFYTTVNDFLVFEDKTNMDKYTQEILINSALHRLETSDKSIIKSTKVDNEISNDILVEIPILDKRDIRESKNIKSEIKPNVHLNIIKTTSITAYEDVEKRFKQSRDIDDALFLAKSYYKKENFIKSEYWAYETNKLDSSLEESFFIFVKSKMKLGQKNEAISILNAYFKRTGSNKARVLLKQFKNNKF